MHNGMINLDGVKMSKSLGNLVKVSELLTQGHTPDSIRLMLLGTHYREDREFVADLDRWEQTAARLRAASEARGGPPTSCACKPSAMRSRTRWTTTSIPDCDHRARGDRPRPGGEPPRRRDGRPYPARAG